MLGVVAVDLVGRWLGVGVILLIRLQLLLLRVMRKMSVSHTPRLRVGRKTNRRLVLVRAAVVMLTRMMMAIVRLLPGRPGRAEL